MSTSSLRTLIVITGLFTAVVHLFLLKLGDPLFTLNGLGYLALLAAFLFRPGFLAGRRELLHYAFMAYAAATIVAFLAIGGTGFGGRDVDILGWVTKADEAILIAALWMHLQREGQATPASM